MAEPSESPSAKGDVKEDYKMFLNAINESLAAALTTSQERYETIILGEETTKAEIMRLRAELEKSKVDQVKTEGELETTKVKLVEMEMELGDVKGKLYEAQRELDPSNSESEMARVKENSDHCRNLMALLKTALKASESRFESTQHQLMIAQTKLSSPHQATHVEPESASALASAPSSEEPLPGGTTALLSERDTFCNDILDEILKFSKTALRDVHDNYEKALDTRFEELLIKLASRVRLGPLRLWTPPERYPKYPDSIMHVWTRPYNIEYYTRTSIGPLMSSFQANRDLMDPVEKSKLREDLEDSLDHYALFHNDLDEAEKTIAAEYARLVECDCHEKRSIDLANPLFKAVVDIKNGLQPLQEHNVNWWSLGQSVLLALDDRMFTDEWDTAFKALVIDTIKRVSQSPWPESY